MQMFRTLCKACGWIYDTVVLPMPITEAARTLAATCCPMCANRKGNTVAPARDLTDAERHHKVKLEAARAIRATAGAIGAPQSASGATMHEEPTS